MKHLGAQFETVRAAMPLGVRGQVEGISGLTIEASELALPIGSVCRITRRGASVPRLGASFDSVAEVIGFQQDRTLLMPLTAMAGVSRGDAIHNITSAPYVWCSPQLAGRVLDGLGRPIDGRGPLLQAHRRRIDARSVAPLERQNIRQPIATSIRSIDALHTCGLGQRMGVFSGPGVGKSTLMASIAKHTSADISVVALIGERGREVQEFIEHTMGPKGMQRCVVVVSTGDDPPLLRVRAAKVACAISEYFRDCGKNVLLLMDSLTRLCQAQRQIGLAAREPPATKGFPPSVFALLPEILERAGKNAVGSITGFYTVLVEGDDFNEPIPDAVKGISDGHIWLSRTLANRGHFPAVDVLQSISRVRGDVCVSDQVKQARKVLALLALYHDIEDLVNLGSYVRGSNAQYDLAVDAYPRIISFLQQEASDAATLDTSRKQLSDLCVWIDTAERALRAQQAARANPAPASRAPAAKPR